MKVLNKVVIGMASLALLAACGPSKVSYEKFHEKAVEAAKLESGYTSAVLNGKMKSTDDGKSVEYEFKDFKVENMTNGRIDLTKLSLSDLAKLSEQMIFAIGLVSYEAVEVENDKDVTYYAGDTFKVSGKTKEAEGSYEFNKFGLITSMKVKGEITNGDLTVTWSK